MDLMNLFNDVLSLAGNRETLDNETLLSIAKEKGLDDHAILELKEAFKLIDNTSAKVDSLNNARREGITRMAFMENEIKTLTDSLSPEDQEVIFTSVEKSAENVVEQISKEEE